MQMNIISNAGAAAKSASETGCPVVASGRLKSGAGVPSGNIVELTAVIGPGLAALHLKSACGV